MTTRILPQNEWPRIAETGVLVDKRWELTATLGCVVAVEIWTRIIGLAFVFITANDNTPHIDGLWIEADYRGNVGVGRGLRRGVKAALDLLGADRVVPITGAVWMHNPQRRAHGIEL